MQDNQSLSNQDLQKRELNQRIDEIGWGLVLISIGGILLAPNRLIPQGAWSICIGLIMLGLNWVRYLNGIKMSSFTFFLGCFALAAGLGDFFSVKLPLFAILLIFIGASIILKPLVEKVT